jgi:hypothetical protein
MRGTAIYQWVASRARLRLQWRRVDEGLGLQWRRGGRPAVMGQSYGVEDRRLWGSVISETDPPPPLCVKKR